MSTPRGYAATAVWNNRIYVSGGLDDSPGGFNSTRVEAYDPTSDTWTSRANAPTARKLAAGAVVGDRILILGGLTGCGNCGVDNTFAVVDEYDPVIDRWKTTTQMTATRRAQAALGAFGSELVTAGGINSSTFLVDLSSAERATLNGESSPAAAANLQAAAAGPTGASISWAFTGNAAAGFRVERRTSTGDYESVALLGANSRSFSDIGLKPNTVYAYRVEAFNGGGASVFSSEATLTTPVTVPGPPLGVSAIAGASSAFVNFLPPASDGGSPVTRYDVTASPGGAVTSSTVSPIQVSGLANGTAYSFTVTAWTAAGPSNASAASNTVVPSAGSPSGRSDAYAVASGNTLVVPAPGVLANDDGRGAALNALLLTAASHGTAVIQTDGSVVYVPDTGFSGLDSFTYRATNASGSTPPVTVWVSVLSAGEPGSPTSLRVSAIAGNTLTFEWVPPQAGPTPTGYVLEGGVTAGQTLAAIPLGPEPSVTLAMPAGRFFVRIRATAGGVAGAASTETTAVVGVPALPSSPTQLLAAVSGDAVNLTWSNSLAGGAPSTLVLGVTGSASAAIPLGMTESFSAVGVPPGSYNLSLSAQNAAGASGPSNAVTVNVPAGCSGAPQALEDVVVYASGRTVTARWAPPLAGPAPDSYVVTVSGAFSGSFATTQRRISGTVSPGTYLISVAGANSCGSGLTSQVFTVVVP
jgi:hypothetical protein